MPARPRPPRLCIWLLALAATAPPAGGAPAQQPAVASSPSARMAVIKGRVTDKNGAPLPGARVLAAWPAVDMRFVDPHTGRPIDRPLLAGDEFSLLEARSDGRGDYRLELPGIAEPTRVSLDAMTPGYRRLVGTLMKGGDARQVEATPGREAEANLVLETARYYAGTVVDEQGRPIAGAQVIANVQIDQGSGGVEWTMTGPDGAFELFNYPTEPFPGLTGPGRGVVYCSHPDYITHTDDQVDQVDRAGRDHLRVVLPTGRKVAGTVRDEAGRPVAGALVMARITSDGFYSKGTRTDAAGRFALRGLGSGAGALDVRAYPIKQKFRLPLVLDADKADLEVKLRPIAFPKDVAAYDVLGMRLADVTPEMQAAYDLAFPQGAVVLDPGPDSGRLQIGPIAEGNEFWMAGQQQVRGLRDFVDRIIAEAGGRDADEHSVRVVYRFTTPGFEGNATQHLKLTRDDLRQLKALAERLKAEAR